MSSTIKGKVIHADSIEVAIDWMVFDKRVEFGLYCARDAENLVQDERIKECNDAVEKWLESKLLDTSKYSEIVCRIAEESFDEDKAWEYYYPNEDHETTDGDKYIISAAVNSVYFAIMSVDCNVYDNYCPVSRTVYYITEAKSWKDSPGNFRKRKEFKKKYLEEYLQIAQSWGIVWENPSKNLLAISDSCEFGYIFFDLIQDEREMCDVIIPYNGIEYYLNVCGYKKKFVGTSQEEVIERVIRSGERDLICKIIQSMLTRKT